MGIKTAFTVLFLAIAGLGLAGCDTEGPAERTGEQIDRGIDDAGDRMDRAGEPADQPDQQR